MVIAALAMAYANTWQVPFLLDDTDSILANPSIRSLRTAFFPPAGTGITVGGRPMVNASLAVNYAFGGFDASGYHLLNLLVHGCAALFLFGVVRRTLRLPLLAPSFGRSATTLALLMTLLWALHPLQTESVTYVIQRAESLMGLFYLGAVYAFVRATESPTSRLWPALTFLSCLLGMATKEVMASAPLILFFYDAILVSGSWQKAWQNRRNFHLALASTWLLLGALVIANSGRGATVGFAASSSWWSYALVQTTAIVRYLGLTLWPADLVFDYGANVRPATGQILFGSLVTLALLTATVVALRRKSALGFLGLWFFAILAPSSSLIPVVTQTIAEHRMYLPLVAIIAPLVLLFWRLSPTLALTILLPLTVVEAFATYQRNLTYHSAIDLWRDTVAKRPDQERAHLHLGDAYLAAGRTDEGIASLEKARSLAPQDAKIYNNLGLAYAHAGRNREALAVLEQAVKLAPDKAPVRLSYGNTLLAAGRQAEAMAEFERAVALSPDNSQARFALANGFALAGRTAEAIQNYERALQSDPGDVEVLTNLGAALARAGRIDEAIARNETAVRLKPDSVKSHLNLGIAFLMANRRDQALAQFREAARLGPVLPQDRYNLGGVLAEMGQPAEALQQFEALLTLGPPTAELHFNAGVLCAQLGRAPAAIDHFRRALSLAPNYPGARENLSRLEARLGPPPSR